MRKDGRGGMALREAEIIAKWRCASCETVGRKCSAGAGSGEFSPCQPRGCWGLSTSGANSIPEPGTTTPNYAKRPTRGRFLIWWPGAELNHRHKDFQSSALPTELPGQIRYCYYYDLRFAYKPLLFHGLTRTGKPVIIAAATYKSNPWLTRATSFWDFWSLLSAAHFAPG